MTSLRSNGDPYLLVTEYRPEALAKTPTVASCSAGVLSAEPMAGVRTGVAAVAVVAIGQNEEHPAFDSPCRRKR